MSPQQTTVEAPSNVDVAKSILTAYGKKDFDALKPLITSDCVYEEVASLRKAQGLDQVLTMWKGWGTALPDSTAEIHSALGSGNSVTLELTWRGTHSGPLQMPSGAIPATGKKIEIRACQVIDFAGGKARGIRHYFDMVTLLKQLGVTS